MNSSHLSLIFVTPVMWFAINLLLTELSSYSFFEREKNWRISLQRFRNLYILATLLIAFLLMQVPVLAVATLILGTLAGTAIYREVKKRRNSKINSEILESLPSCIELLTILIASGHSPSSALVNLSQRSTGHISDFLGTFERSLRSGASFNASLDHASAHFDITDLSRFCDSLIVATQQGNSLVDALTRQVFELRAKQKARTLERVGKIEIGIMIPVVFLILPISVVFALWPSFLTLGEIVAG